MCLIIRSNDIHGSGLGWFPLLAGDSVVVGCLLFIVAQIVCGFFVFVPCIDSQYFVSV